MLVFPSRYPVVQYVDNPLALSLPPLPSPILHPDNCKHPQILIPLIERSSSCNTIYIYIKYLLRKWWTIEGQTCVQEFHYILVAADREGGDRVAYEAVVVHGAGSDGWRGLFDWWGCVRGCRKRGLCGCWGKHNICATQPANKFHNCVNHRNLIWYVK